MCACVCVCVCVCVFVCVWHLILQRSVAFVVVTIWEMYMRWPGWRRPVHPLTHLHSLMGVVWQLEWVRADGHYEDCSERKWEMAIWNFICISCEWPKETLGLGFRWIFESLPRSSPVIAWTAVWTTDRYLNVTVSKTDKFKMMYANVNLKYPLKKITTDFLRNLIISTELSKQH